MTTTKKTTPKRNFSVKAMKLPPNPFQHEILELVDKQRTKAKRIEFLKEYDNDALKALLIWNFDDSVISLLPDGHVPYKENEVPVGTDHTSLRRETMFIQMLEGLHPEEAALLCLVKDKQLGKKYKITKEMVSEAFPDITWGGRS